MSYYDKYEVSVYQLNPDSDWSFTIYKQEDDDVSVEVLSEDGFSTAYDAKIAGVAARKVMRADIA